VTVTIQDFSFAPAAVTIKAGTAVHWSNGGPSAHTTTSDTGVWDSGTLAGPGSGGAYGNSVPGAAFNFTFTQPGTYSYHCNLHPPSSYPGFTGTITVTP
jgi:plastocyanin